MADAEIDIEVVFAMQAQQCLLPVRLSQGSTVADAIKASGIAARFPDEDLDACKVGVWGRVVSRARVLADGDRVELYRPLRLDPREARRQLAAVGQTMSTPKGD